MDLSSLSVTTRKVIILTAVGIIAAIIIRIAYGLVIGFIQSITPEKQTPPNNIFGTLDPIKFPEIIATSKGFTFNLETVDAKLPAIPELINVYKINRTPTLFLSLETAKKTAQSLGFREEPKPLSQSKYQFTDTNKPGYTLIIDIISSNLTLKLDTGSDNAALAKQLSLDKDTATKNAYRYLSTQKMLPTGFDKGKSLVKFLKIAPTIITEVVSADQANGYRVDIFPDDLEDKFPILTQDPNFSPLNVTFLAGNREGDTIYQLNTQTFDLDTQTKGTYQTASVESAWTSLNEGKGYVLKTPNSGKQISIHKISLGYFLEENSNYLKPVFIFEGSSSVDLIEPNFVALLPAIAQ